MAYKSEEAPDWCYGGSSGWKEVAVVWVDLGVQGCQWAGF